MSFDDGQGLLNSLIAILGSRQIIRTGLLADYQLPGGSGGTVADHSGAGNTGTLAGSPLPTWGATGLTFGANTANRITTTIPWSSVGAVQFLCTLTNGSIDSASTFTYVGSDSSSGMEARFRSNIYPNPSGTFNLPLHELAASGSGYEGIYDCMTPNAPCLISFSRGSTQDYAQINNSARPNQSDGALVLTPPTLSIGNAGNLTIGADGWGNTSAEMIVHRVLIYGTSPQITPAQFDSNFSALVPWAVGKGLGWPWVNPSSARAIHVGSDSLGLGLGISYSQSWFPQVLAAAARAYVPRNYAIGGRPLRNQTTTGIGTFTEDYVRRFQSSNAPIEIVIFFAGTNDFALYGDVAANVFAELDLRVRNVLAMNPNKRGIVIPMISRTGFEAQKNAYNALIAANTWDPSRVVVIATSSCPTLYPDGSCNDASVFQGDKVHLLAAGYTAMVAPIAAAVNALDPFIPGSHLLDSILAPAAAAYSTRLLSAGYAGKAIRVRRDSDNTELDIGFAGNDLDAASLATFVGSNSGYISKMYDQTGNGLDMVQATQSAQPQIVASGTPVTLNSKAAISNPAGCLLSPATNPTIADHTIFAVVHQISTGAAYHGVCSFGTPSNGAMMLAAESGSGDWGTYGASSPQPAGSALAGGSNYLLGMVGNISTGGTFTKNGGTDGTYASATGSTNTHIGGVSGQTNLMNYGEVVCWASQLGNTDFNTVRANINAYWGIY